MERGRLRLQGQDGDPGKDKITFTVTMPLGNDQDIEMTTSCDMEGPTILVQNSWQPSSSRESSSPDGRSCPQPSSRRRPASSWSRGSSRRASLPSATATGPSSLSCSRLLTGQSCTSYLAFLIMWHSRIVPLKAHACSFRWKCTWFNTPYRSSILLMKRVFAAAKTLVS